MIVRSNLFDYNYYGIICLMEKSVNFDGKTILITGAAGFIGWYLAKRVCEENPKAKVIGFDSVNDYYDVRLKEYRLKDLDQYPNFTFVVGNLADKDKVDALFNKYHFDIVVNLAAQAGVRYSIEHPDAYIESNIIGFYNIHPFQFIAIRIPIYYPLHIIIQHTIII